MRLGGGGVRLRTATHLYYRQHKNGKMKITFIKKHGEYKAGSTHDVETGYGTRLISSGVAKMFTSEPAPEPEGVPARDVPHDEPEVETAVTRPRTKRRRPRHG